MSSKNKDNFREQLNHLYLEYYALEGKSRLSLQVIYLQERLNKQLESYEKELTSYSNHLLKRLTDIQMLRRVKQ